MLLLVIAYLSGVLTVLSPCVLPILPIILGSTISDIRHKYAPYVLIGSLAVSVFVFSLLLKATTFFIDVPPSFWKIMSGGILVFLGLVYLFPNIWQKISARSGADDSSHKLLNKASSQSGYKKYALMGAALGPVFSSCSPTYALILAIILPANFGFGLLALGMYVLGLASVLAAITFLGQKIMGPLKIFANPRGTFKKILGVILILIGVAIMTGFDKKVEAKILDTGFINITNFESKIIDNLDLDDIESQPEEQEQEKNISQEDNISQTSRNTQEENICSDGTCGKEIDGSFTFLDPKLIEGDFPAPEFRLLTNWINSDGYDSIDDLKGKVVMIEFWTLGCINCIRTHPHNQALYEKYKDQGFEIIGIHAPEFAYERNLDTLKNSVDEYGLTYPIVQDNEFETWKAYNNRYWPAFYILDKQGNIRYTHFGEKAYDEKDQVIEYFLIFSVNLKSLL